MGSWWVSLRLVSQKLPAATWRSNSPLDCHSFRSRRFARSSPTSFDNCSRQTTFLADRVLEVPSRLRQQKRTLRSRQLSVGALSSYLYDFSRERFLRGFGGSFFSKKFPRKHRVLLSKIRHNVVRVLCRDAGNSDNLLACCLFEGGESAEGG